MQNVANLLHVDSPSCASEVMLFTVAAVNPSVQGSGCGGLVLDDKGNIKGALEVFVPALHLPLAAECQAILHGLRLLQRLQISHAHVFSDSLMAIRMINAELDISSEVHHWIMDIRDLRKSFITLIFSNISRHRNSRAIILLKMLYCLVDPSCG